MFSSRISPRIAILYQAKLPPMKDGVQKAMKPGGYSDSGADIAYKLKELDIPVITPKLNPLVENDFDWVFSDNVEGIQAALDKGANILWLNTILYKGHSIERFFGNNVELVGQLPCVTDLYDDKFLTNNLLIESGLTVLSMKLISKGQHINLKDILFPCVLKPLRGRGSQGVVLVEKEESLKEIVEDLFSCGKYGNYLYIEKFLAGQEVNVTVMPPGSYKLGGKIKEFDRPWSLPAVKRFNHIDGIAPYNGTVAVTENSCVLGDEELVTKEILELYKECEKAFSLVKARAPIRIDCRADESGKYWLFDLNVKPNMTGASRPHRLNQDSLTALSAKKIGWSYGDLLTNILEQRWKYID